MDFIFYRRNLVYAKYNKIITIVLTNNNTYTRSQIHALQVIQLNDYFKHVWSHAAALTIHLKSTLSKKDTFETSTMREREMSIFFGAN